MILLIAVIGVAVLLLIGRGGKGDFFSIIVEVAGTLLKILFTGGAILFVLVFLFVWWYLSRIPIAASVDPTTGATFGFFKLIALVIVGFFFVKWLKRRRT
jgi:hypothetical protein